jgi:predicted nucleic acid-binding protein
LAKPGRFTVDASVFVSALRDSDPAHEQSHAFLGRAASESLIFVPTLVKPEVAGAMSRATGNTDLARHAWHMLSAAPRLTTVAIDDDLAEAAADFAAEARVRGADSVYVATARRFDATLVTLDEEQKTRLPADMVALYPSEALEAM